MGTAVKGKGICEAVELMLGEWKVVDEFLPLELGGVDAILGMQWLYSLRTTEVDWRSLRLTLSNQGKKIVIQGDRSLTKAIISLKKMMKMMGEKDQGFLVECRALTKSKYFGEEDLWDEELLVAVIPKSFEDVFEWPETLPPRRAIEHHIHLKRGRSSECEVIPLRISAEDENGEVGSEDVIFRVIRPSTSPYSSPVLLVRKKDGSWQFCVDYRALNNVTVPDKFHIRVVEELFDELNGATMFSKIDLKAGYHQIRMCPEDVQKTAFRTHEGHYEFLVCHLV